MVNEVTTFHPSISCSWDPDISGEILSFGDKDDSSQWDTDGAIEHSISEENFVCLQKTIEDVPCMIYIKTNDPLTQITNISLVSEAHVFEVYGKHGEYIKTLKCDYLGRERDIDLYVGQTTLLTTHEISIKFPGLTKKFWLCGIKLIVNKLSSPSSIFDYHLIDEKLKSSTIPITEKAEKFKKFLQEYTTNKYNTSRNVDPQMLYKFIEAECFAHLKPMSSTSNSMSKYLSTLIPSSMTHQNVNSKLTENEHSGDGSSHEECASMLKSYVDESLQKLEEKLQKTFKQQLEDMESKQNEKLDTILELLRNSALR